MINRVQEFRKKRRLSLEELALSAEVSVRFLRALESGKCIADVGAAIRIAKALGSTVEELFDVSKPAPSASEPPATPLEERDVSTTSDSDERETSQVPEEPQGDKSSRAESAAPEPDMRVAEYEPRVALEELSVPDDDNPLFHESSRRVDGEKTHVGSPSKNMTISSYSSKTAKEEGLAASPKGLDDPTLGRPVRYFDLFCGIGGFRYAVTRVLARMNRDEECILACDVDPYAQQSYAANFGDVPFGDVTRLPSEQIPDFDLLLAGFPFQTYSIIGTRSGFEDELKDSLFLQIARILRDKRPRAFILENVRQLTTHDSSRTFRVILRVLQDELEYNVDWRVLNALDCGLPQKRERVVLVGSTEPFEMEWPRKVKDGRTLADILEPENEVPKKYYASPNIVRSRKEMHKSRYYPSVWHENKSGHVTSYPYSCALRAGASYNYLLVNGERRFTPRELLRLQGFPDDFKIAVSYAQLRRLTGAAASVDLIERALERFLPLVFTARRGRKDG
ncbi:MAG: DNA (cytosine-5-)-methyltransferase [Thermoguttaceae bacterium]|jgi:DNA (cytosine-5)-methyltransferase 1